ncbi:MAG TPA: helix-turn-helix domain-containing protein [Micromonosporaceae bacterium]|nr:helix-turn-helix domain-containing protein [Micromonosporaceae bacterium]
MDTPGIGPTAEMIDTPRHRALASAVRVVILHLVRRSPAGLTVAEVAAATDRHPTTVREHLDQLAAAGLVVRERGSGGTPGRPAWRYRAGQPPPAAAGPYRELAGALVDHIALTEEDPWTAGMAAGRAWGRKLASTTGPDEGARPGDRLIAVLDRLGFAPRVVRRADTEPVLLHLHSCPFLDLVDSNPDVVCGLHLGVVRGVLGATGAPGGNARLDPFAAAGACVVRLAAEATDASAERA